MAAAEKISFVGSPQVLLRLVEKTAPAVQSTAEETQGTSPSRKSRVQMQVQAPRFTEASPKAAAPQDYIEVLIAYMAALLTLSVTLAKDQSKITQSQTSLSQAYVTEATEASNSALAALKTAQQEQSKQASITPWQKILGYLGAGLMLVIGALLENPQLIVTGVLMIIDQAAGLSDKLTDYLSSHLSGLPTWAKDVLTVTIKVAIALVLAVAAGGICGGAQALAEQVAAKTAAQGAAAGIEMGALGGANAVAGVAANAAAEIGAEAAAEAAGEAAANGAASGANGAAASQQSFLSRAFQFGFKNGKGLLGYGQFVSTFAQMTIIVNPFTDIIQMGLTQASMSDSMKKVLAQVLGMVTALIFAFVAGQYSGLSSALNLQQAMAKATTYSMYTAAKAVVGVLAAGSQIANGGLSIQKGIYQLDQSDATKLFGQAQAFQLLFTTFAAQIAQMSKQTQAGGNAVNSAISSMNERWDAYVAPYQLSANIAG